MVWVGRCLRRPRVRRATVSVYLTLACLFAVGASACGSEGDPALGDRSSRPMPGMDPEPAGDGDADDRDFGNQPSGMQGDPPPVVMQPLAPQGDRDLEIIDDCPGPLSDAEVDMLDDPNAPGGGAYLYPYEGTVFPRGLQAPVLQWQEASGGGSAILIRLTSMLLEYRGCFSLSSPVTFQIPQDVWDLASSQSRGKGDPLVIEVSVLTGGAAVKLPRLKLTFALAKLKGAIYYNTYGSALATQMGVIGGVVMRVTPGEDEPDVFLTAPDPVLNCVGCHAVTADGSRMVAEIHVQPGLLEGPSSSFDLTTVGDGVNPAPMRADLPRAGFSALYPDGSVYLTTGRTQPGPFGSLIGTPPGNITGTFGPEESKLYDTDSGAEITGSGIEPYAYMPMFSVDGSAVVFNKMDTSGVGGHTLTIMDFDRPSTQFSNARDIFSDSVKYPGWPFFLPDVFQVADELVIPRGKRVVFALGEVPDFVTQEAPVGITPHLSDLWWVDADTGMAAPLNAANGLDDAGNIYLPYGERDAHRNYLPTISPVAAGGYFWMFFSSKRNYGTLFSADPPEVRAESKKIWVSAIDIDAPPGSDPSHPAFFLPGQEIESGNIRAFAALEPCQEDGSACESGIDCCCGFCIEGVCGCKVDECSEIDEKCETAADCCSPSARCVGGFCALVVD